MGRLLVIDEDSGRRLILRSRLSEAGYELVLAENGARGLIEARNGDFDAILVDARLATGVDGCEVCRRLKAIPERTLVPVVIYVEDSSGADEMVRAYEAGCDAFVTRQDLPALEHVLRGLARQRARLVELHELVQALTTSKPATTAPVAAASRAAPESPRRDRPETELALAAEHVTALRELASGRPDGVLVVDAEGLVRHADRGACELLGSRIEGSHLGSLIPASGLEAFVRDARVEAREGLRFDLPARRGRPARPMVAVVVPLLAQVRDSGPPLRVVQLHDGLRRRLAAESLRVHEPALSRAEAGPIVEAAREAFRPCGLLGTSALAAKLRADAARAAAHHEPLLLRGERGSGRGRLARTIHWSGTSIGPLIELRCGAHTEEHLEAELFGSARTASALERPGLFHLAQDGTLFLEEIGELPLALQARVLRFLETGLVERRGSARGERLEVRLIASTSGVLEGGVAEGRFRADLLERLGRNEIDVPRLADRLEDLEALALAFARRFGGARGVESISPAALAVMQTHPWPGNLVELESCLERACARARAPVLVLDDLPRTIRDHASPGLRDELTPQAAPRREPAAGTHTAAGLPAREIAPVARPYGSVPSQPWDVPPHEPVSLELYERLALLRAIAQCDGDKLAAAKILKLGKSTMYRKLKRYGIA
ncbi:MAG: sigma 54-interacting transcriptional regulator [Planctomycetota bacterium]|nr:sigma 54-interacting transcriptional regulator [Planctomycetota bacterium]